MDIVVHSKNSLIQLKNQKKLYHCNKHKLGFLTVIAMQKMIQSDFWSRIRIQQSDSDSDSDS